MSVKVNELMADRVMTATPHQSVGHVKGVLAKAGIHALPVSGPDDEPVGIITTADLLRENLSDGTPIGKIMTQEVTTVPIYEDVMTAARMMRRRRIHHLVVVHEKKIVGMLSSFDLLKLVEEHRFVAKEQGKKAGRPRSPSARKEGRHRS